MKFHLFVNLEKEIRSRIGKLHFRRWSLLQTPFFDAYLHQIHESDKDDHMHDHPWDFVSFIVWGGYIEHTPHGARRCGLGSVVRHKAEEPHRVELIRPTTTLVFCGKRRRVWGYDLGRGGWMDFMLYRRTKDAKRKDESK